MDLEDIMEGGGFEFEGNKKRTVEGEKKGKPKKKKKEKAIFPNGKTRGMPRGVLIWLKGKYTCLPGEKGGVDLWFGTEEKRSKIVSPKGNPMGGSVKS